MNNPNFAFSPEEISKVMGRTEQSSNDGAKLINEPWTGNEPEEVGEPEQYFVTRAELHANEWRLERMAADSPSCIPANRSEHWRLLMHQFETEDVIWTGNPMMSGRYENIRNFQPVSEWLKKTSVPGSCISASTFKIGSYSRCNDNVLERRFLVVSSKSREPEIGTAVIRWLKNVAKLELKAVVHNGTSRYWGWFRYPEEDVLTKVTPFLRYWCDPSLWSASHYFPMPGTPNGKHTHQLVWLD